METVVRAESNHMYSWWWASHISPKNSKWLQENLKDMDSNVKQMIKIIEVDEDSFARRAEMYYKKRPELMKLVEEFYRAYRALAERYDHATGVIRHAHKTVAEAFPNQVPFLEPDSASCEPVALSPSAPSTAELAEGKVGKALSFYEKGQGLSQSERLERSEIDIKDLKEALSKLEAEKEKGLVHYQESMQRLSSLEYEVLLAQRDSRGFRERASKAETEVLSLKECLAKLEGEREASLSQYQQYLNRIFSLESCVSCSQNDVISFGKRACEAVEEEAGALTTEKEAVLAEYLEALEKIANLENKLMLAEDKASLTSERADNAEKEVAILKEKMAEITEEKEAAALQYHECLERIASLESEIAKLKGVEEQCLLLERSNKSMKSEMETVMFRLGIQNEELSENNKELGRLRKCVQEERLRFVEAETAFRALQSLHSQTQEELRLVSVELQKRVHVLKDMEVHNQNLEGEVQKISINSAVSLKNMQDEIVNLKEGKEKLERELELRLKDLQQENSKLKEACGSSETEISVLLVKLGVMEKLNEKNVALECSLSVLSVELEDARGKIKAMEKSCQLQMDEKTTLISQLASTSESLENLSKTNTFLLNTLFDVNAELEALRARYGNLEDSCRLLSDEKSILFNERRTLELKLETAHQKHAKLEKSYQGMGEERVSMLRLIEELQNSLAVEKQDHDKTSDDICKLHSDLKKVKNEAELWETVACTTFVDRQTTCVREVLYREKLFELTGEYQYLLDQNHYICLEIVQLKEQVVLLERENSQMEAQRAGYEPAMATIRDALASLERHAMHIEVDNRNDEDVSDSTTSNVLSDLHDIAMRIKVVDNKMKETKSLAEERSLRALESPSRGSRRGISRSRSRRFPPEAIEKIIKQQNQTSEPEEAVVELAMKDIMLDQTSRASSRRMNRKVNPYNNFESDDDQTFEKMPVEKELRVDSLELSKRYTEPNELSESNKNIMERLSLDVQKLTNLQETIQDLKQKVDSTGNSKPAKANEAEYAGVKEKIEETERAISKLLEANNKLLKGVQDCSIESPLWPTSSSSSLSYGDPSKIGECEQRRREAIEQAKRSSEKIGRLQVETQKIQFLLLRLDGSNKTVRSSRARFVECDRKVLLQDYLYGRGPHAPRRSRSKARFCARFCS